MIAHLKHSESSFCGLITAFLFAINSGGGRYYPPLVKFNLWKLASRNGDLIEYESAIRKRWILDLFLHVVNHSIEQLVKIASLEEICHPAVKS